MNGKNKFLKLIIGLSILALMLSFRFLPHPPNVSPLVAMALFGGGYFSNKKFALALPILILFLSDLILGFYPGVLFVYSSFLLIGLLGTRLSTRFEGLKILGASLGSSILFFIGSNLGVWWTSGMYSKSFAGLIQCYTMAIPFFRSSLVSDLVFSFALFGIAAVVLRWLNRESEILQKPQV